VEIRDSVTEKDRPHSRKRPGKKGGVYIAGQHVPDWLSQVTLQGKGANGQRSPSLGRTIRKEKSAKVRVDGRKIHLSDGNLRNVAPGEPQDRSGRI